MALGDSTIGVLFRLKADTKSATDEISSFRGKVTQEIGGLIDKLPGGDFVTSLTNKVTGLASSLGGAGGAAEGAEAAAVGLGGVAAAAGGVILAVGAAVGIIAALTVGIFAAANMAADYAGKIHDASIATGASVEMLSALELTAKQSNVSIEELSGSLGKFNRLIGQAAEGSKEATLRLRRFGIDPLDAINNQEEALGKVFKRINDLPPGIQRIIAAQDAFGKSGARMVDLIQNVGGNFDEFMKKARAAGDVLTQEDANAADEFGDKLEELSHRAKMVGVQFGLGLLPGILGALDEVGQALDMDLADWKKWGEAIGDTIAGIGGAIHGVVFALQNGLDPAIQASIGFMRGVGTQYNKRWEEDQARAMLKNYEEQIKGIRKEGGNKELEANIKKAMDALKEQMGWTSGGGGTGDYFTPKAGNAADKARQEAIHKLDADLKTIEDRYKEHADSLQREYDLNVISSQTYTKQIIAEEDTRLAGTLTNLDKQLALAKKGSEAQKIQNQKLEAQAEHDRAVQDAQDAQQKREEDSLRKHREALLDLADRYDSMKIKSTQEMASMGAITAQQSEDIQYSIQTRAWNRRVQALSDDWEAFNAKAKESGEINLEINQDFSDKMDALVQEQEDRQQDHERNTDAITKAEERAARDHARALKDIGAESGRIALELTDLGIKNENRYLNSKRDILEQEKKLEMDRADADSAARKEEIERRRDAAIEEEKDKTRKLELEQAYNLQLELEEARHNEEIEAIRQQYKREEDATDPLSGLSLFGDAAQDALDAGGSMWEAFGATVQDALNQASQAAGNFGSIIGDVFSGISNAIGQSIKNWVLLGNAGGQSFRKFTAEILAGVAAQAAVKAIWELAEGFAALANPWTAWQAPIHFHAAALYGTVAAIAAVTGRLVAGNAFQNQGASAGGGAGAGASGGGGAGGTGSGSSSQTPQPVTLEQDRRQVVEHIIIIRPERGWFADHFVNDLQRNGPIRTEIQNLTGTPNP